MVEESAARSMYVPLAPAGLALVDRIHESADVGGQFRVVERRLTDRALNDAGLFGAEFDGPALGRLDRRRDVRRHGANLGVRHQAARPQNLAQTADERHHVGRGDAAVEVDRAALHGGDEVLGSHHVGAGVAGFVRLEPRARTPRRADTRPVPLGRLTTPRTIWSACLGSTPRLSAQLHRFVEFRIGVGLDDLQSASSRP